MRLDHLAEAYRASHRARLGFDGAVRRWLAERVKATPQGARFLDGIIARAIRPSIADYVLDRLSAGQPPGDATVGRDGDGFKVRAGEPAEEDAEEAEAAREAEAAQEGEAAPAGEAAAAGEPMPAGAA